MTSSTSSSASGRGVFPLAIAAATSLSTLATTFFRSPATLLPKPSTVRLACWHWFTPIDELFSLDAVQLEWYSVFNATRYILIAYGVTRGLVYCIPALRLLDDRRKANSHKEGDSGCRMVLSWRTIPYFISTYFIKSSLQSFIARPVEIAMNLTPSSSSSSSSMLAALTLHWANLPMRALRLVHYCGMRAAYRDPIAVAQRVQEQLERCAATQPSSSSTIAGADGRGFWAPSTAGCNAPRATIAYAACESFLGRLLRLFQPFGTLNAFRVCDSITANDQYKGCLRRDVVFGAPSSSSTSPSSSSSSSSSPSPFSTTSTTRATFERFCVTTHDIAISLVTYSFTEFVSSFIKYGLIAKAQHGKFEWQFERHAVVLAIRIFLLAGLTAPFMSKVLGATTIITKPLGIERMAVPTGVIAYIGFAFSDALLTNFLYSKYVALRCQVKIEILKSKLLENYRTKKIAKGKTPSPSKTGNTLYHALRRERFAKLFHSTVGVDYDTLTNREIIGVRDFAAVYYINGADGFPFMVSLQFALVNLTCAILHLEALDAQQALQGKSGSSKSRRREAIVLVRALKAGTLQRQNVEDLLAPIVRTSDSAADLTSLTGAAVSPPPTAPSSPTTISAAGGGGEGGGMPSRHESLAALDDDPCPVCLRNLKRDVDDIVVGSSCGHAFHTACMLGCLNMNSDCPMCRGRIAPPADNGFEVPRALAEDAEERRPEEMPENVLELLFNKSGADILQRCSKIFAAMDHWGYNREAMFNYLKNAACKGNVEARDLLGIVARLDRLHRSQLDEVMARNIPREVRLWADVAKLGIEIFNCPVMFYIPVPESVV